MFTSVFNVASVGKREGKGGIEPLLTVKTDLKYSFNKFAFSWSEHEISPADFRGAMPVLLDNLLLMNLKNVPRFFESSNIFNFTVCVKFMDRQVALIGYGWVLGF